MIKPLEPFQGYRAGHPWYYRLGGPIPTPRQIRADVESRDYRGYLADHIDTAAAKPEPQRSEALRALRSRVLDEMRADLTRYRECAQELRRFRNACTEDDRPITCDVYTAISLKTAHLINAFANLRTIEEALSKQGDLFGF
ncbi:hypothetical protein FIU86_11050 [Roseovarius sp. THAF9]|uniref:hypothetical protein n=1 Tax=Roseovarius sp. THAF9 TaxID=2587847 RepID=UPI001267DFDF|nr:hypothetical protein [Roseovarius sp. THAF9]QFT93378.1 hypothetical protein FIU86_11050 [Roseovarius sp. THAF9]